MEERERERARGVFLPPSLSSSPLSSLAGGSGGARRGGPPPLAAAEEDAAAEPPPPQPLLYPLWRSEKEKRKEENERCNEKKKIEVFLKEEEEDERKERSLRSLSLSHRLFQPLFQPQPPLQPQQLFHQRSLRAAVRGEPDCFRCRSRSGRETREKRGGRGERCCAGEHREEANKVVVVEGELGGENEGRALKKKRGLARVALRISCPLKVRGIRPSSISGSFQLQSSTKGSKNLQKSAHAGN